MLRAIWALGAGTNRKERNAVKRIMIWCLSVLIALLWSLPAFSLVMQRELRGDDVNYSPDWPAGLKELVSREGRVYGMHMDAPTFGSGYEATSLFFVGDRNAFNQFLEEYAKLRETPLTLILHPGQGMTGSLQYDERNIPFDWQVRIVRTGRLSKAPEKDKPGYMVTVELWLGSKVKLHDLKVPLNVEVKSGGEIERFIAEHETGRRQAKRSE